MSNNNIYDQLERAVSARNVEKVKALLSAGASANHWVKKRINDEPILHCTDCAEIARALLLGGANVNGRNKYNETPLHTAITMGRNVELVRELLKNGADVNATTRKGNTALNHAVKKSTKKLDVIKELLKYGADINIRNREERLMENHASSLDNAIGYLEISELLIKFTLIRNFKYANGKLIDLSPYRNHSNYNTLSSYQEDCVREIIQMKTHKFYEFIFKKFNQHVLYNNQLAVRLAKFDYPTHYPIYNDIIFDELKPIFERVRLLNKLSSIQIYTQLRAQDIKENKILLDYDSTYKITEYLYNEDILHLIVAFDDDSNKDDSQSLNALNDRLEPSTSSCEAKRPRLE